MIGFLQVGFVGKLKDKFSKDGTLVGQATQHKSRFSFANVMGVK
jgi:hypothetical protein